MSENQTIDPGEARRDPGGTFADPEQVLSHPGLDRDQKIEILRQWQYDAAELQVAEEEGMAGGEQPLTRRIALALDRLTTEAEEEPSPPTKHGT